MLQAAARAPNLLRDATDQVGDFVRGRLNDDGGFANRDGPSDLYYTIFGLGCFAALGLDLPADRVRRYLLTFDDGASLDLVHLTCLARAWAYLPEGLPPDPCRSRLIDRIEGYRSLDGGYHATPGHDQGTIYGCFLAWGAYQDLRAEVVEGDRLADCIAALRADDGGYANGPAMSVGLTPPTAAAAMLMRELDLPLPAGLDDWLLARCRPEGGFFATPAAPIPDLLSTATALHALAVIGVSLEPVREVCLDFLDSLWTGRGGFHGSWTDDHLDCEYTFYGLLALGHLSA